jgi:hypothetical protein
VQRESKEKLTKTKIVNGVKRPASYACTVLNIEIGTRPLARNKSAFEGKSAGSDPDAERDGYPHVLLSKVIRRMVDIRG